MAFLLSPGVLTRGLALLVASLLIGASWYLANLHERELSLALLLGALFGFVLQRSKFCFFCITRDFVAQRNSLGLLGLVAALATGILGYSAVYGAILPHRLRAACLRMPI